MLALTLLVAAALSYPLMDGRCLEYEELQAEKTSLPSGAVIYIFQDESYVWLCHTTPSQAVSWDDIELVSPTFPDGINLHASAQLGEWPLNDPDAQPKSASSDKWWRIEGWWANTPGPNGIEDVDGRRQTRWMNIEAREYQLTKDRFGRGEWAMRFHLHAESAENAVTYPADGDPPYHLYTD